MLIARELGVSGVTIARWLAGPATKRHKKMRAVRVLDADRAQVTAIVATTRDGLRIEGLTVPDLVTVLRGLG